MKKKKVVIGECPPGTKLRVLGPAGSDSHQKQLVRVRCEWEVDGKECGTEKTMRVSAITHPPYKRKNGNSLVSNISCGCQSRLKHRLHWEGAARKLGPVVLEQIYSGRVISRKSLIQLAREFGTHHNVISTAVRLYGEEKKNTGALNASQASGRGGASDQCVVPVAPGATPEGRQPGPVAQSS